MAKTPFISWAPDEDGNLQPVFDEAEVIPPQAASQTPPVPVRAPAASAEVATAPATAPAPSSALTRLGLDPNSAAGRLYQQIQQGPKSDGKGGFNWMPLAFNIGAAIGNHYGGGGFRYWDKNTMPGANGKMTEQQRMLLQHSLATQRAQAAAQSQRYLIDYRAKAQGEAAQAKAAQTAANQQKIFDIIDRSRSARQAPSSSTALQGKPSSVPGTTIGQVPTPATVSPGTTQSPAVVELPKQGNFSPVHSDDTVTKISVIDPKLGEIMRKQNADALDRYKANQSQFEFKTIDGRVISLDPRTGQARVAWQKQLQVDENGQPVLSEDQVKAEQKFRNDYTKSQQYKDFVKIRDSYRQIEESANADTPAGDFAMVFSFRKVLDPGSTVREGEFQSVATARPLLEQYGISWDALKSIWGGKTLTQNQRKQFLDQVKKIYEGKAATYGAHYNLNRQNAIAYGYDPKRTVEDLRTQGRSDDPPRDTGSGSGDNASGNDATPRREPNQAAIDHLKANPSLKKQFDQFYGPGAADKVLSDG